MKKQRKEVYGIDLKKAGTKYIEEHFFKPDFKGETLTVYELRSWPSLMEGKINLCGDKYDMILTPEEIPQNAYIKKSALRNITDTETYNLAPTWKNYHIDDLRFNG